LLDDNGGCATSIAPLSEHCNVRQAAEKEKEKEGDQPVDVSATELGAEPLVSMLHGASLARAVWFEHQHICSKASPKCKHPA
jgi:hypothetical protein